MKLLYFLLPFLIIAKNSLASSHLSTMHNYVDKQTIRIASYNVENLWDDHSDNTPKQWQAFLDSLDEISRSQCPKYLQYQEFEKHHSNWFDPKVIHAKLRNILKVIETMNAPDIIAFQEVESANNTSQIFAMKWDKTTSFEDKLRELGYQYFFLGPQDPTNPVAVTTAIISKLPLQASHTVSINFDHSYNSSARDIQVVEGYIGGERLLIFNSHWKSKRGGHASHAMRMKTAELLKARIDEERLLDPYVKIIVLGDFNCAYNEAPLKALGSTGNELSMTAESSPLLYNLWHELPGHERWEQSFDGLRGTLSQFLISDSLYNYSGLQYSDKSFEVVGQQGEGNLLDVDGAPYRWQSEKHFTYTKHLGIGYSDHLPLVATFKVLAHPINLTRSKAEAREKKLVLSHPGQEDSSKPQLLFTEIDSCQEHEAIDIANIDFKHLEQYIGSCIKMNKSASERGYLLHTRGKFRSVYINIPKKIQGARKRTKFDYNRIGITMHRSFDWRPNISDSRVSIEEASIVEGQYSAQRFHPRSNRCYERKVLSGEGGRVRKLLGRLAYSKGFLNIHIASREKRYIELEQLPAKKQNACPW